METDEVELRWAGVIEKLLLKLRARDDVSAEEENILEGLISQTVEVPADRIIVKADAEITQSTLLLDGLIGGLKDLENGERQFVNLFIPGDFLDLHSFPLKSLDIDMMSLAPSRLAFVPHERLMAITEQHPHLTRLLWFSTLLDASIHRAWLVSIGRLSASARIAHLFCELYYRLQAVGESSNLSYRLALTQAEIAECVAVTVVHANRSLKSLREQKLATFRDGVVRIENLKGLEALAGFDPGYLYFERRAR